MIVSSGGYQIVPVHSRISAKEVWSKETNFSQWLASEAGIAVIHRDVDLLIENTETEKVGSEFKCDIVGNLVGDPNHVIVIENQFGKSDHDHLGKFLTYAANHSATTGIWVAEAVATDHIEVVNWFNENSPNTVNLYLVTVEVLGVRDGIVVPKLNVVCRPNLKHKEAKTSEGPATRNLRNWRHNFWLEIHAALDSSNPHIQLQAPGYEYWSAIALGRSGFHLAMLLLPKQGRIGLEVVVRPKDWESEAYEQLYSQRLELENEVPGLIMTKPGEPGQQKAMLYSPIDPTVETNRQAVIEWFVEYLPKLNGVFRERVAALKKPPSEPTSPRDDDTADVADENHPE